MVSLALAIACGIGAGSTFVLLWRSLASLTLGSRIDRYLRESYLAEADECDARAAWCRREAARW